MCGFGPLSDPAVRCGNLFPHGTAARQRNGTAVLAFYWFVVGWGHYLIHPLAAETFIPHSTLARQRNVTAVLAVSCSCVDLGHYPIQPLAAETFTRTARRHGNATALQFWCVLAPVWVWAII